MCCIFSQEIYFFLFHHQLEVVKNFTDVILSCKILWVKHEHPLQCGENLSREPVLLYTRIRFGGFLLMEISHSTILSYLVHCIKI